VPTWPRLLTACKLAFPNQRGLGAVDQTQTQGVQSRPQSGLGKLSSDALGHAFDRFALSGIKQCGTVLATGYFSLIGIVLCWLLKVGDILCNGESFNFDRFCLCPDLILNAIFVIETEKDFGTVLGLQILDSRNCVDSGCLRTGGQLSIARCAWRRRVPLTEAKMVQSLENLFKVGRLRFGLHGILGVVATILNVVALANTGNPTYICSLVVTTSLLAFDARSLISQVPEKTRITAWIVAPHREAFQRTIAILHYVNLRICREMQWLPATDPYYNAVYFSLVAFCWTLFLPIGSDFSNGNTWIFVIPMFAGVSFDAWQQALGGKTFVTLSFLLCTQLSALTIAFVFTLAFRAYVDIKAIYALSAICVAGLLSQVFSISLPLHLFALASDSV
jgi:hypothetical protein